MSNKDVCITALATPGLLIIKLGVALSSCWQLARYLKMGEKAMPLLPCEARIIYKQLSSLLGYPDHPHFYNGTKIKYFLIFVSKRAEENKQHEC